MPLLARKPPVRPQPAAASPIPQRYRSWRLAPWRDAGAFTLILFPTFIAYLPALNGTLLWDDGAHINKPEFQSLYGLHRVEDRQPATPFSVHWLYPQHRAFLFVREQV
jgi:hypothetical protein